MDSVEMEELMKGVKLTAVDGKMVEEKAVAGAGMVFYPTTHMKCKKNQKRLFSM
jgi:hypothetical protein